MKEVFGKEEAFKNYEVLEKEEAFENDEVLEKEEVFKNPPPPPYILKFRFLKLSSALHRYRLKF